jgi:L-alanine-DL-glutamate epimerase-like enolase superfamily enzyme
MNQLADNVMKIKNIRLTPLFSKFKTPYVWAMGKNLGQVESPDLTPSSGKVSVMSAPGLGFTLNQDAVGRAAEAYDKKKTKGAT